MIPLYLVIITVNNVYKTEIYMRYGEQLSKKQLEEINEEYEAFEKRLRLPGTV